MWGLQCDSATSRSRDITCLDCMLKMQDALPERSFNAPWCTDLTGHIFGRHPQKLIRIAAPKRAPAYQVTSQERKTANSWKARNDFKAFWLRSKRLQCVYIYLSCTCIQIHLEGMAKQTYGAVRTRLSLNKLTCWFAAATNACNASALESERPREVKWSSSLKALAHQFHHSTCMRKCCTLCTGLPKSF